MKNSEAKRKYLVELTEKQLQVLAQACELLGRIGLGQIREVFDYLPLKEDLDYEVYHEIQDRLTKEMPRILKEGIDGWASSLGVGHKELPESNGIAWDLRDTFRHRLSWDRAVDLGYVESLDSPRDWSTMLGVSYDKPFGWGTEPLPPHFHRL